MKMPPRHNPTITKEPYCFCSFCWTFWTGDEEANGKRENARIWACPECVAASANDPDIFRILFGERDDEGGVL